MPNEEMMPVHNTEGTTSLTVRELIQQLANQESLENEVYISIYNSDPVKIREINVSEDDDTTVVISGGY